MVHPMNVLDYLPKVNVMRALSDLYFNWETYFDRLYKRPDVGTVIKNSILSGQTRFKLHTLPHTLSNVLIYVFKTSK